MIGSSKFKEDEVQSPNKLKKSVTFAVKKQQSDTNKKTEPGTPKKKEKLIIEDMQEYQID